MKNNQNAKIDPKREQGGDDSKIRHDSNNQ